MDAFVPWEIGAFSCSTAVYRVARFLPSGFGLNRQNESWRDAKRLGHMVKGSSERGPKLIAVTLGQVERFLLDNFSALFAVDFFFFACGCSRYPRKWKHFHAWLAFDSTDV